MDYLKIFTSFAESIEPLSDAECGRLFRAMLKYAESGAAPEFNGNERFLWPTAKQHIDHEAAYLDKKRAAGSIGGKHRQANASTAKQTEAKPSHKDKEKEKDNISLPTVEIYAREKHKYGTYKNVLLTDEELEKLKAEFPDWQDRIERVSEYVAKTGKGYKNYLAVIRSWARKDEEKKPAGKDETSWMKEFLHA